MTTLILPDPIAAYFAADQRTPETLARCFTAQATVRDEGKTHCGRDAIAAWKSDASARYTYTAEPSHRPMPCGRQLSWKPGRSSVPLSPGKRLDRIAGHHPLSFDLQLQGPKEVMPKGVRVLRVSPGWIGRGTAVARTERLAAKAGMDQRGQPADHHAVVWRYPDLGRSRLPAALTFS